MPRSRPRPHRDSLPPATVEPVRAEVAFAPEEFAARRARVFDAIGEGAAAVLQGAGPVEGFDVFRQTNEFHYLSGVEVPQAYLLLDGRTRRTSLYLPHRDSAQAAAEGDVLSAEDEEQARAATCVDAVKGPEALLGDVRGAGVVYLPQKPPEGRLMSRDVALAAKRRSAEDPWDSRPAREDHFASLLHARLPQAEVRDLSPVIDSLRLHKSPREIALLRRAARLAGLAVAEAMRSTRPGVFEYELDALAQLIFVRHGARGPGYRSIIAGGANAWHSHYFSNDCPLRDGDLVLMDCAPDYSYYTSDIGRMWPVSGRYRAVQRELYGFVVEYHQALLQRIRPGVVAAQVMDEVAEAMGQVVSRRTFSKAIYEQAARKMLEFRGHLSHPVGMAVHDVGDYHSQPLAPGLVFTVDPQMWVPEEKLYIRCEDTVAVTEDGIENLTGFVPLGLDEVEALMTEDGLLQTVPRDW
jgi:Xaa-Pro aminopeptidase